MPLSTLIDDNVRLVRQGIRVLEDLDDELYTALPGRLGQAAIGGHFRHCIDHYACLLHGATDGVVDYDRRERDPRLENERAYAIQRMRALALELEGLRELRSETPLQILAERGPGVDDDTCRSSSSLARELHSTASHTVHHFALIAVFLRALGVEPPPELGVAPSTLRHWEETRACAP